MERSRLYLVGLLPPDSVERTLIELKRLLFRRFSLVSALALRPLLPLAYRFEPVPAPAAVDLPRGAVFTTGGWEVRNDVLFLAVDSAETLQLLLKSLTPPIGHRKVTEVPVPLFPGLYLARLRETSPLRRWPGIPPNRNDPPPASDRDIIGALDLPPRLRWKASTLVCWELQFRDRDRWWDAVESTVRWEVRLRKRSES